MGGEPVGSTIAFSTAVVTGIIVSGIAGRRLTAKVINEETTMVGVEAALTPLAEPKQ